ncbi:hypothetical protein STAFG_8418 [Streptomyces afghaniensis 772]|uniref:Uncharacterized protein n=2 Tax=Streptomyces TaxID=1883 RepID=S4MG34_9ACTN|nr:hypothetical protein STAFG_8418 [Streptomyces afghaniensis 772]
MKDVPVMVEFLKARLREDETAACALKPGKDDGVARLKARVLADVEAKRRLVAWVEDNRWTALMAEARDLPLWQRVIVDVVAGVPQSFRSPVVSRLVMAYVDHPDFRPEWKLVEVEDEYEPADHEERR